MELGKLNVARTRAKTFYGYITTDGLAEPEDGNGKSKTTESKGTPAPRRGVIGSSPKGEYAEMELDRLMGEMEAMKGEHDHS